MSDRETGKLTLEVKFEGRTHQIETLHFAEMFDLGDIRSHKLFIKECESIIQDMSIKWFRAKGKFVCKDKPERFKLIVDNTTKSTKTTGDV